MWSSLVSYIDSYLKAKNQKLFQTHSSIYRFEDGKRFKATKKTQIPAEIGSHKVLIEMDVINIVLLLNYAYMKRAYINLNFRYDTLVFSKTMKLVVTKSGYDAITLTVPCKIIHSQNSNVNVTLTANQP